MADTPAGVLRVGSICHGSDRLARTSACELELPATDAVTVACSSLPSTLKALGIASDGSSTTSSTCA